MYATSLKAMPFLLPLEPPLDPEPDEAVVVAAGGVEVVTAGVGIAYVVEECAG